MIFRPIFSELQVTTLVVILLQILSSSHMLPISSPSRQSDLELLLDPIYQAEQDVQETKKIVTKSVFSTVLKVPAEQGCPNDMRRVQANGPCVMRYEAFDDSHRLAALKELQRQGAFSSASPNRRKRPNNRNRGSTSTPKSTTTTDGGPVEGSTLHDLEGGGGGGFGPVDFVDMTPTRVTFPELSQAEPLELDTEPPVIFNRRVTSGLEVIQDTGGISHEQTESLSSTLPTLVQNLTSSDFHSGDRIQGVNVTRTEKIPINTTITIADLKQNENVKAVSSTTATISSVSTTPSQPELTIQSSVSSSTIKAETSQDGTVKGLPETLENNEKLLTTIKPDSQLITAQFQTQAKNEEEKLVEAMGQNVMVTHVPIDDRGTTTTPTAPSDNLTILINNSTEDPVVSLYNQDRENYPTVPAPVDPIKMDKILSDPESLPHNFSTVIEPVTKTVGKTNDTLPAASILSSSPSPLALALEGLEEKLQGFNYSKIESDNPLTDNSTPAMPDMTPPTEIIVEQLSENTSVPVNSSEIDSTTTTLMDPVGISEKIIAKESGTEAPEDISETGTTETDRVNWKSLEDDITTESANDDLVFDESSSSKTTPEPIIEPFESQESTAKTLNDENAEIENQERKLRSEAAFFQAHQVEELDRIHQHHKSKTRNREKNPDFSENLQEAVSREAGLFSHDSRSNQHHEETVRRAIHQDQGRSLTSPRGDMGFHHPQPFVALDYLKLGDNYRRFRVF